MATLGPQMRERAHPRVDSPAVELLMTTVVENDDAVAKARVDDANAAVNLAAAPIVVCPSSETPGWDQSCRRRSSTSGSTYVVAGSSIVTPAAISSEFFCLSHDSTHCSQLDAAVDVPRFVGVCNRDGFDRKPARPAKRDDIRQVALLLRIRSHDVPERLEKPVESERVRYRR